MLMMKGRPCDYFILIVEVRLVGEKKRLEHF
jgi:hypothetical protein